MRPHSQAKLSIQGLENGELNRANIHLLISGDLLR